MGLPLTRVLVTLALTSLSALGADNSIGAWVLNIEKSKYDPPPFPLKSLTTVREVMADGGVKVATTGYRADGSRITMRYTAKYDGSESTVSGINAQYQTISVKQTNANTFTTECKRTDGSYQATERIVISSDGKTMTTTAKGRNAEGREFTSTFVFERQ